MHRMDLVELEELSWSVACTFDANRHIGHSEEKMSIDTIIFEKLFGNKLREQRKRKEMERDANPSPANIEKRSACLTCVQNCQFIGLDMRKITACTDYLPADAD